MSQRPETSRAFIGKGQSYTQSLQISADDMTSGIVESLLGHTLDFILAKRVLVASGSPLLDNSSCTVVISTS